MTHLRHQLPFAYRELWNIGRQATQSHCALMLAARITLPHFSVSSAINLPKSAGEPVSDRAAQVGKPRLHLGIGEAGIDLLVELVDDLGGCVPGCADTEPSSPHSPARTRPRSGYLAVRPTRRGRNRQRTQLAGPDVLDRRGHSDEGHLDLTAERSVSAGAPPRYGT